MECRDIHDRLYDYAARLLGPGESSAVESHCKNCRDCREELKEIRGYMKAMSNMPAVKAPDRFLSSVKERMEEKNTLDKLIRFLFYPLKLKIPLEAAGVIGIAVIVLVLYKPVDYLRSPDTVIYEEEYADKTVPGVEKDRFDKETAPEVTGDTLVSRGDDRVREPERYREEDMLSDSGEMPVVGEAPGDAYLKEKSAPEETVASPAEEKPGMVTVTLVPHKDEYAGASQAKALKKESMSARFDSPDRKLDTVKQAAEKFNGRIAESSFDQDGNVEIITVEIPAARYETFLAELKKIGTVVDGEKSLNVENRERLRLRLRILH